MDPATAAILLSLAVGLGCRSHLGAVSANGHLPLSCTLCSLAGLQPAHNPKSQTRHMMDILLAVWILCLWAETGRRFPAHGWIWTSSSREHLHGGQGKAPSPARQCGGTGSFRPPLPPNRCLAQVFWERG